MIDKQEVEHVVCDNRAEGVPHHDDVAVFLFAVTAFAVVQTHFLISLRSS